MRCLIFLLLFAFSLVQCKNHVKSLTESLGQEVIEISAPLKELPPGLDEEPSAEAEEDEKTSTAAPPGATKRENRKTTTQQSTSVTPAPERRSESLSQEEDERRIEKELSEIYKDTDYKGDPTVNPSTVGMPEMKPALRQRGRANFKFQPDLNDRADVERFRTSVDDISCEKRVTQRLHEESHITSGCGLRNTIAVGLAFLSTLVCQ